MPNRKVLENEIHSLKIALHECEKEKKAALKSNLRHRRLLNHAGDILLVLEMNGKISNANETALKELGYSHIAELKKLSIFDIDECLSDEPNKWGQYVAEIPATFEGVFKRMAREPLQVEIRLNDIELENGTYLIAMAREISERKKMEVRLRESEKRYRSLVEDMPAIIFRLRPDGRFIFANDACILFFNIDKESLQSKSIIDLMPPKEKIRLKKYLKAFAVDNAVGTMEHPIKNRDGNEKWIRRTDRAFFHEDGKINEIQCVAFDITEMKKAEAVLKESEERHRVVAQQVADGIMIIKDGIVVHANTALANMFGFSNINAVIGKRIARFITEEFRSGFDLITGNLMSGKTELEEFQALCKSIEGRYFWMDGHLNYLKWKESSVILATVRDVTESKKRELTLLKESAELKAQYSSLKASLNERYRFGDIVGKSPVMHELYELISKAAESDANVVLYGESGTGKDMVAKTIHNLSVRHEKGFVPVNCGAIPESLFESEFFGHVKGAFTGAHMDKHGFFDIADGGTLFLDEVGELAPVMQVKLLRAIENKEFMPVGAGKNRRADVRIIAATNRDLKIMIEKGKLREDFYFRIHVIVIHVPPLKQRKEDIPLLIDHFMALTKDMGKIKNIPGNVLDSLMRYDWPGNVRELQNVLQRYLIVGNLNFMDGKSGNGLSTDKPCETDDDVLNDFEQTDPSSTVDYKQLIDSFERKLILNALAKNRWHKADTARYLGLPRRTFFRKLKMLKINSKRA